MVRYVLFDIDSLVCVSATFTYRESVFNFSSPSGCKRGTLLTNFGGGGGGKDVGLWFAGEMKMVLETALETRHAPTPISGSSQTNLK